MYSSWVGLEAALKPLLQWAVMCYGINDGCLALWVSPVLSFGTQKSGKLHQFMLTQVSDQFYIKFIQTKWIPEKPNLSLFWQ